MSDKVHKPSKFRLYSEANLINPLINLIEIILGPDKPFSTKLNVVPIPNTEKELMLITIKLGEWVDNVKGINSFVIVEYITNNNDINVRPYIEKANIPTDDDKVLLAECEKATYEIDAIYSAAMDIVTFLNTKRTTLTVVK